jgi:hypothetical protein
MAASIPSADRIGKQFANPVVSIARTDVSNVGKGLQIVAAAVDHNIDKVSRFQYAQAASEFLVKKNTEDNAYDNDQEYGTIENRYSKNIDKSLQDSANLIMDPRLRNEFLLQYRPQVAEGVSRIRSVASSKEKDYQRGYVTQQLEALTEAGLTGDMDTALATSSALLITARDSGYISAQEYESLNKTQRQSMVVKSIEMLEPKQQLAALETPSVKNNLPADVEFKLRKIAQSELVKGEAIANVDTIMADIYEGGSRTAAQAKLAAIEDPDLRVATEQRFENEYNRYQANKGELQEALSKKYAVDLRLGNMTFDQIPRADLDAMDPSTLAGMQAAERTAASGVRQDSDRQVLYNVYSLMARAGDPNAAPMTREQRISLQLDPDAETTAAQDAQQYTMQNSHLLNNADFKDLVQDAVKGVVPEARKPLFDARAQLNSELALINPDSTEAARFKAKQERRLAEWYDAQKTPPTPEQIREQTDILFLETIEFDPKPNSWLPAFDVEWAKLSPESRQANVQKLINDKDARMLAIVKAMPGATVDQLMAAYKRAEQ